MTILITGGTGFIGCQLALNLRSEGRAVRVLGQTNNEFESENAKRLDEQGVEVLLASVTDRAKMFDIVDDVAYVYHFAAAQHEANAQDELFHDVNVMGTQNLLDASVATGVKRFVHGSTIGVYGSAVDCAVAGAIHEESPMQPDNIYGKTKLAGEELVLSYSDKLPVVIIRISEVYGPGDQRLLKLFKGIQKGVFFKIGPGKNLHHLIYVDDLIAGFKQAATVEDAIGKTFILAGKDALSTDEMIDTVANELNVTLPPVRAPLFLFDSAAAILETTLKPLGIQPPLHRRRMDFFRKSFFFSSAKAQETLGFAPQHSFEEGVAKTADWYQAQGFLNGTNGTDDQRGSHAQQKYAEALAIEEGRAPARDYTILTAKIEQFDSFWEGPDDVEKGYGSFGQFYRANYLPYMSKNRDAKVLCISCGPGYFVNLLKEEGYRDVLGIDSDPEKVGHTKARELNCIAAHAVDFLASVPETYDAIVCEQELNHLTKDEMVDFLRLCWRKLGPNGRLLVHGLNGANPLTGSDASAQNFDHYNTFTEYSLQQVLEFSGFTKVRTFPLNLYVFFDNPLNYVGLAIVTTLSLLFRVGFLLYGKKNKIFTKKIGAVAVRGM